MTNIFLATDPVADLSLSVDTVWMLLAAMLVFFMQPGFALCEAGFTRSKNTANTSSTLAAAPPRYFCTRDGRSAPPLRIDSIPER